MRVVVVFRSKIFLAILLIVLSLVGLLFVSGRNHVNVNNIPKTDIKMQSTISNALGCLKQLFTDDWEAGSYKKLSQLATRCTSKLFYSLPILRLGNPAFESKYYLPPQDHFDRCSIVTLGIGYEIFAETELKKNLPQCTFLGADPNAKTNKKLFEQDLYGVFVESAVSGKNGNHVGNFLFDSGYSEKKLEHISLQTFLLENNGMDQIIDLLLIDVEGAEFGIFDALIYDINQFPTICQINAEIHTPDDKDAKTPYIVVQLYQLMLKSSFIPLRIDPVPSHLFYRIFLFNYGNTECVKKYFKNKSMV